MGAGQLSSPLGASGRAGDSLKMNGGQILAQKKNLLIPNQMCKYEQQS